MSKTSSIVFNRSGGGLDVLVNNVGGTETKPCEVLSDEDWQRILEVNLLAAVRLDRAFLPGIQATVAYFRTLSVTSTLNTFPLSGSVAKVLSTV